LGAVITDHRLRTVSRDERPAYNTLGRIEDTLAPTVGRRNENEP
jgi:hypothetical protein